MKDRAVESNKYLRSLNIIILESNPEVFWCISQLEVQISLYSIQIH